MKSPTGHRRVCWSCERGAKSRPELASLSKTRQVVEVDIGFRNRTFGIDLVEFGPFGLQMAIYERYGTLGVYKGPLKVPLNTY